MSALHAVPDPDEEEPPAGGEEWLGDEDQDDDPDDAAGEETQDGPRRAITMPDLRPYADPHALAELAAVTAEIAVQLARLIPLGRLLTVLAAGSRALLRLLAGWLSGTVGPKSGSAVARLGGVVAALYAAYRMLAAAPLQGTLALAAAWAVAAALAQRAAAEAEKGEKEKSAQPGTSSKKSRKKTKEKPAASEPAPTTAAPPIEQAEEVLQEEPLTALLRELIGEDRGVHLQVLRPAMRDRLPGLEQATDEELRQHLIAAGYDPTRKVRSRGVAGRAGIHRDQLPPLPSSTHAPRPLSATVSARGDAGQSADSPRAESRGDSRGDQPEHDDYEIIPDPDRGPTAWRILRRGWPAQS
jgi:hypothetical protein